MHELTQLPAPPVQQNTPNNNSQPAMLPVFGNVTSFEAAQRMAQALAKSTLIPEQYRDSVSNCLIAMEMANRVGMSVLMVMQNLNMIDGKPSWAATFLVASINASGRFSPLRYEREDRGQKKVVYAEPVWDSNKPGKGGKMGAYTYVTKEMTVNDYAFRAVAIDAVNGEKLVGPWVSIEMAIQDGWYHRKGSKYKTMPEVMLQYRAASFFSRLYCPEISLGMHTADEVMDYAASPTIVDTEAEVVETTAIQTPPGQNKMENIKKAAGGNKGTTAAPAPAPVPDPVPDAEDPILPEGEEDETQVV